MVFRLAMLLAIVLAAGCEGGSAVTAAHEVRSPAVKATSGTTPAWQPEFVSVEGHRHRPFKNPSTKAVVLIFALPDCPIANSCLPEINRIHEDYAGRGIELWLVHADPDVTAAAARDHARQYAVRPNIMLDADHAWARQAGATKTPEAAVFSPTGTLLYRGRINDQYAALGRRRAQITSHDLRRALNAILKGRTAPLPFTEAVGCDISLELTEGR